MGQLDEVAASLVAITPQTAAATRPLAEKHKLTFDILSDPGNQYAARLGLRFALPEALKQVYLSFGNDLAVHNGEGSWTLAMPARLVVDRAGVVRVVDADPDYRYRPEPAKTVEDVKALAA